MDSAAGRCIMPGEFSGTRFRRVPPYAALISVNCRMNTGRISALECNVQLSCNLQGLKRVSLRGKGLRTQRLFGQSSLKYKNSSLLLKKQNIQTNKLLKSEKIQGIE